MRLFFMLKKIRYFLLTKSVGFALNLLSWIQPKKSAQIAYRLFSHPRKGKREQLPDFLAQAQQQPILIDGKNIHIYEWKNEGEKILLIHGWESNAYRWIGLIQFLKKKNFHIIAIDAPAQGLSDGYELNPIVYSQAIDEVCQIYQPKFLVGHSFGGFTSLYYQSVYQNKQLSKIVIMGSPNKFEGLLINYKHLLGMSNRAYRRFLRLFKTDFGIDLSTYSAAEFIAKIQQPILWIHDETDTIVPYNNATEIRKRHPEILMYTTKNVGHSLYNQAVYKQMYQFLTE